MIDRIARLAVKGVKELAVNPTALALTLSALVTTTFLCGLLLLAITNLDREFTQARAEFLYQVYFKPRADKPTIDAALDRIKALPEYRDLTFFSADQAFGLLQKSLGREVDLTPFKDPNPLSAAALVALTPAESDKDAWSAKVRLFIASLPGVESVTASPVQEDMAKAWSNYSRKLVWPLMVLLSLLPALVVGNTVRLAQAARRDEVEILHLVGARTWYIVLPLVAGGVVLGSAGVVGALFLLKIVQLLLKDALNFAPLFIRLEFPAFRSVAALFGLTILAAATASALGAWKLDFNPKIRFRKNREGIDACAAKK